MAILGGWWISPSGRIYEIIEHRMFIQENPGLFKFDPKWVIGKSRNTLLVKAMKQGWVRVRGRHGEDTTYQFWALNAKTMKLIKKHLKHVNAWDTDQLNISELSQKKYWHYDAGEFMAKEVGKNPGAYNINN